MIQEAVLYRHVEVCSGLSACLIDDAGTFSIAGSQGYRFLQNSGAPCRILAIFHPPTNVETSGPAMHSAVSRLLGLPVVPIVLWVQERDQRKRLLAEMPSVLRYNRPHAGVIRGIVNAFVQKTEPSSQEPNL